MRRFHRLLNGRFRPHISHLPTAVLSSPHHAKPATTKRPFPFHIIMPTQTAVLTQYLMIPRNLNHPAAFAC
ncbi:MAG: hypothetical protein R6X34_05070 [Chloroflexota bacterium]